MRTQVQATGSAAAATPWVPVSDSQNPFNVGLFPSAAQDFAATSYQIQYTPDDPQAKVQVTFTTTGTTATVTDPNHGMLTGDSVVVTGTGTSIDTTPAAADVTVIDDNTYTYTTGAAPPAKGVANVAKMRVFSQAVVNSPFAATNRVGVLLQAPCRAVRVRLAGWTVGILSLLVIQAASRTN